MKSKENPTKTAAGINLGLLYFIHNIDSIVAIKKS